MLGSMVAFALPLGTDSAAVCTAYGAQQGRVPLGKRVVIVAVLTGFEALMPGVGMLLSGPLAGAIGSTANYFAALLLVGLGLFLMFGGDDDQPDLGAGALLMVGLAVSIDEVAVGVSLGLHGVPFVPLALTIGVWVGAATTLGLHLGSRVPPRFHDVAGVVAAVMLIALGVLIGCGIL